MTPLEYYQQQVESGFIQRNLQQEVINQLQSIYTELFKQERAPTLLLTKLLPISRLIKGLYLWGNVGVGKIFLIDIFYHSIPLKKCDCIFINLCYMSTMH